MQIRIRPVIAADIVQVAAVNHESWQFVCHGLVPPERIEAFTVEQCLALWNARFEQLDKDSETLLVCEENGSILGFSYFGPSTDPDVSEFETGQIFLIYVRPEVIGYGVGKELMKSSLESLRACGYNRVSLWVLVSNERARAFYSRHEFTPDGSTDLDTRTGTVRMRYFRALSTLGTGKEIA